MDYTPLIEKRRQRLEELETVIAEPDFFNDQKKASEIMREHRRLKELMETWDSLNATEQQLADNQELAKTDDPELAELAALEIPELEAALEKLRSDVQYSLLPRDTTEDRDAIIEIRAGTGGDEASLFAGDLLRMYQRFAEERGWRFEHLESSPSDVGGFKEVVCRIAGEEVFRFLKYEGGVHRVQRVPATETQGRIPYFHRHRGRHAGSGGSGHRNPPGRSPHRSMPFRRSRRPACEQNGIRRSDMAHTHGRLCPVRGRAQPDEKPRKRHENPARQAL